MCEGGVRKMAYKLWTKMEGGTSERKRRQV